MTEADKGITRRQALLGVSAATATLALSGCASGWGISSQSNTDRRVDMTRDYIFSAYPAAEPMIRGAKGVLYMPLVTGLAFGPGGAYGEGALRVNDQTVDYYSAAQASIGLQAGAQQYSHVLVFSTDEALDTFRASGGWVAGAGAFYAVPAGGLVTGSDTLTKRYPIIAMIFGQSGLMAGAAIEGTKYTRIALNRP